MWCTRWFLPLLLLPLPTASPYFLILFLVSLTLHARPCFYCIVLLTALFTSSCYWQPVPTEVILRSIYPHLSTSEATLYALNLSDSNLINVTAVPNLTSMNDRCWCDLSGTSLFEPFNTTQWQLDGFARTIGVPDAPPERSPNDHKAEPTRTTVELQDSKGSDSNRNWITDIISGSMRALPPSNMTSVSPGPTQTSEEIVAEADTLGKDANFVSGAKSLVLPPIYDLRPYGINLIVDFSWPRNPSYAPVSPPSNS